MARTARSAEGDQLKAFAEVAKDFEGFLPASKVLTEVRAVRTIFPQIDVATRVQGWPLQRVAVIHGPSNHGKTLFLHGLGASFLRAGHFNQLIDAEFTTDMRWLRALMGPLADSPAFLAMRPKSYEQTTRAVRDSVNALAKARDDGRIPKTTSTLIGVDSIRKLVPEKILEQIEAEKGGVDGRGGTTAMFKAALNAAWLDELVPLLYHTNSTLVIIAREAEKIDATKYEQNWKVGGGKSLVYDSSIAARITRAEWVTEGEGKTRKVLGERHRVAIHKTKIAGKDDKEVVSFFHSSNGTDCPEGFDLARDVFELAVDHGLIKRMGQEYVDQMTGEVFGKSENASVRELRKDPERLLLLENQARAQAELTVANGGLVAHESPGADPTPATQQAVAELVTTVRPRGKKRG